MALHFTIFIIYILYSLTGVYKYNIIFVSHTDIFHQKIIGFMNNKDYQTCLVLLSLQVQQSIHLKKNEC